MISMSFLNQDAGIPANVIQSHMQPSVYSSGLGPVGVQYGMVPGTSMHVSSSPLSENKDMSISADNPHATENAHGVVITRRFCVLIHGTLQEFSRCGPAAGRWAPNDNKATAVFGLSSAMRAKSGGITAAEHTSALSNVRILQVRKLSEQNTFPCPLGVSFNCIPSDEKNENGHGFLYTTIPNCTCTTPEIVYESDCDNSDSKRWRTLFPTYNSANLESHGIFGVEGDNFRFVDCNHPVIHLLRANRELLGSNIDSHAKFDDKYFKVSIDTIRTCCAALREHLSNNVSDLRADLNTMEAQITRADGGDWVDPSGVNFDFGMEAGIDQSKLMRDFQMRPRFYVARFEMKYEVPLKV